MKRSSFELWQGEYRYVAIAHLVRNLTEPNSVILAGQHSGAVRYYAGRMTLNLAWMDPDWLDRTVTFLEERGVPPYALLDEWEVDRFRKYFEGEQKIALLDAPPVLEYLTSDTTRLFSLRSVRSTGAPRVVREQAQPRPVCYPPAGDPRVILRR